jgi:DNA-binding transcriptional MerR regulator
MYPIRMLRGLSTGQVAKKIGTTSRTLFRWIEGNLLPSPKRLQMPGHTWYIWSDRDVKRAQTLKKTVKRGRKPKRKVLKNVRPK